MTIRDKNGQFEKGHPFIKGGEKGWFKKGHKISKEIHEKLSKAHKGIKLSEETKQKISKAHKGKHLGIYPSEKTRKKMSKARMGYSLSDETKKKIGNANSGEKSSFWKGGITPLHLKIRNSVRMKKWREAVFIRDNYTCYICEKRGGVLHPHHLKRFADYPKLRFKLSNGLTLCEFCHKTYTNWGTNRKVVLN